METHHDDRWIAVLKGPRKLSHPVDTSPNMLHVCFYMEAVIHNILTEVFQILTTGGNFKANVGI